MIKIESRPWVWEQMKTKKNINETQVLTSLRTSAMAVSDPVMWNLRKRDLQITYKNSGILVMDVQLNKEKEIIHHGWRY
jgi:hypothetical protein